MQLSNYTMQVMKNFATINSNLVVKQGNNIMTMSEARNILGSTAVEEEFPKQFGIYDMQEVLGVLGLVDAPRITFEDGYALIADSTGRAQIKYFFSDTEMLTSPSKEISMPEAEVKFSLDQGTLNNLKRAAAALGHSELSITGGSGVVTLSVIDSENSTSDTYSIDVPGDYESEDFNFILNISNLKIIPANYQVEISSKLISRFTSTNLDRPLTYWLALEKSSTYN